MAKFTMLKNNELISEQEWHKKISHLETKFNEKDLIKDPELAKRTIKESLIRSVSLRSNRNFGILFSGGLDSSLIALICKNLNKNFKCFSVGLENSSDLEYANKVGALLKLDLKTNVLTLNDVERILKECIKILKTRDVVKLEVATVVYAGLELADKNNCRLIFAGGGSEEIFAGYDKHINYLKGGGYERVHNLSWEGLRSCYGRDLVRDFAISRKFNIELLLPFFDFELIKNAMAIHPILKVNSIEKKIILRDLAFNLGLPKEIAYRKRTAAQYGSKISNAILRLSKKNGHKFKQEYIDFLTKICKYTNS